jgi:23S rRNA (cytosine1962-C5)-methyltransferase
MKLPDIEVNPALRTALADGHPWVYRNQVRGYPRLDNGTWVRVHCGPWHAIGLWDDESPIAIRIFSRTTIPDRRWIRERLHDAFMLRERVRATGTTAYRWLFGESDGVPGLTIDLYGAHAVVAVYARSVERLLPMVVDALRDAQPLQSVLLRRRPDRDDATPEQTEGKIERLWGDWPPRDLTVTEHGLLFYVNLFAGQKTGLFLDHRDNRHTLEQFCHGKRVLNCFAYTGAFSLYAARGGARHVTTCDIAPDAVADAERNFALNGFDPALHSFIAADVFDLLAQYAEAGDQFDIVVLDPPSFARARKHVEVAVRAYTRLNQLALRCITPGGLLVTASCTSQVAPDMFRAMVATAAGRAGRRVTLIHEAGQAVDHPVAAHFPEGRYLKFLIGRAGALP